VALSNGLGPLALALTGRVSPDLRSETPEHIAAAVIEIAARQVAEGAEPDPDGLSLAMARVVMGQWPGVDRALVHWLGEGPTAAKLSVVSEALWHLWTTAAPHPPIEPGVLRSFIGSGEAVSPQGYDAAPYRAALHLAAQQVGDPSLAALAERARSAVDRR
jgi:hypothetical protein